VRAIVVGDLIYRTVVIYFVVLVVIRMMGKREIGQFSPFDFVVAIIVAEIATIPIESPSVSIWYSVIPLAVLAALEIGLSFAALYSRRLRAFLDGRPLIVIDGGRILKKEMRRARYNLDELLAQLREKGYPRPEDVEYAVLETSGRLSVVPKPGKRPVTYEDLGLPASSGGLPKVLVMDGEVFERELERYGHDMAWLEAKLTGLGLQPGKVFLATLERDGRLFVNDDPASAKK
jgi:uncharacterized membrane protein YcaP (DUF421 family)